jgi:hypothetical protein
LQDGSIPLLTEVIAETAPAHVGNVPMTKPDTAPAPAAKAAPAGAARSAGSFMADAAMLTADDSIPTLTVVAAPASLAPASLPPAAPAASESALANGTGQSAGNLEALMPRLSPDEMEQLQHKLSERVLRQLQGRIDFVLEQRVRDSLADVLQLAMAGLTNDIKRGLQYTLEEVVGRAVTQEIARLQSGKK